MSIDSEQLGQVYFESPGAVIPLITRGMADSPSVVVGFGLPEEWAKVHGSSQVFMDIETVEEYIQARREYLDERDGERCHDDQSLKWAVRALHQYAQHNTPKNGGDTLDIA